MLAARYVVFGRKSSAIQAIELSGLTRRRSGFRSRAKNAMTTRVGAVATA